MKKVDQTIFYDDPEREGNCLSACVATYLELPLLRVPHFVESGIALNGKEDRVAWWSMFVGFMAGHGFWPEELQLFDQAGDHEILFVMGPSPRGKAHQVLYTGKGELWHDPHPSRDGILEVKEILAVRPLTFFDHTPTKTS